MTKDDTTERRAAIRLLRSGRVTLSEAAGLAETSRQLVSYWARQAGIDAPAARAKYLKRLWDTARKR